MCILSYGGVAKPVLPFKLLNSDWIAIELLYSDW